MRIWGGGFANSENSEDGLEPENPYATNRYADAEKADGVVSINIPATVESIDPAFFQQFPNAQSVSVDAANTHFISINGMLFGADEVAEPISLLLVPEGMEGNAVLPETVATVPACVLSRCNKLSAIRVQSGSTGDRALAAADGILYTNDMTTLLAAPAGLGTSARIAPECTQIAEGAFWGNAALETIVASGDVQAIDQAAFMDEVVEGATVALTGSSSREAWEAAGFTRFTQPAQPGAVVAPAEGQSGFSFTLLPDYTMSVAWQGGDCPADVSIPDCGIIDGVRYAVSAIADDGFAGQEGIAAVTAPASTTRIGANAFAGCAHLAAASLPNSVTSIGQGAFEGTALASLVLPASLQSVGSRAFAALDGTTIVALKPVPDVAPDALEDSTGLNVYAPYEPSGQSAWRTGLPTSGNHLLPYGVKFADGIDDLTVGQTVDMFADGGYFKAPAGVQVSFGYKADSISVDTQANTLTAKAEGDWTIGVDMRLTVTEMLVEGPASRVVELTPASYGRQERREASLSAIQRSVPNLEAVTASGTNRAARQISVAVPMRAVFDTTATSTSGYDVTGSGTVLVASCYFENRSGEGADVQLAGIECQDIMEGPAGAQTSSMEKILGAGSANTEMFGLKKAGAANDAVKFGYKDGVNNIKTAADMTEQFTVQPGEDNRLNVEFSLDLNTASLDEGFKDTIDAHKTEHDMAKVIYTFRLADQGGGGGS